jgi:hypothetical protein
MLTRKMFLAQLANGGWAVVLAGCGGGGSDYNAAPPPAPSPTPAPPGGVSSCSAVQITGNHGHALSIPVADLMSTVAMSYNIQGSADHNHQVTFSPAQLASLQTGASVTVSSTTTLSHSHDLSETCT